MSLLKYSAYFWSISLNVLTLSAWGERHEKNIAGINRNIRLREYVEFVLGKKGTPEVWCPLRGKLVADKKVKRGIIVFLMS